MSDLRTIHVDWYNRSVRTDSGSQLAYQYDHLSNLVIFDNAPKLENYYLIVEMKETEDGEITTFDPIQLGGPFWLIPNYYTQLPQDISYQVCCRTESGDFEKHSAQFTGRILPSKDHDGSTLDVDPTTMFDPYKEWVNEKVKAAGAVIIDPTLTLNGAAADAKAVGDEIADIRTRLSLRVYLSTQGTATAGTFQTIVSACSKGASVYGFTSTSGNDIFTLASVDLESTPLPYKVGTITFVHVDKPSHTVGEIKLKHNGSTETWSYSEYTIATTDDLGMTESEAAELLVIAKGGS